MSNRAPVYNDNGRKYRADACRPLVEAASANQIILKSLRQRHYPGRPIPPGVLSGLSMIGYWDARFDQNWGLRWHRNEGIELTFLESGKLGFGVDAHEYDLQPDDLTITRPWQQHRVGRPNVQASRLHWLIMDIGVRRPHQDWKWPHWFVLSTEDMAELTSLLRENEHPIWKATPQIRCCFRAIARAIDSNGISQLTVRINELFLLIFELLKQTQIRRDPLLTKARRTVHMFLGELRADPRELAREWSLDQMADRCGLGVTQFVHYVKALTNMAPMHYLSHCRLELAAKLLRERPDVPITETALCCGFSSSQYFATLFGRKFGCAPREFRRREPPNTTILLRPVRPSLHSTYAQVNVQY